MYYYHTILKHVVMNSKSELSQYNEKDLKKNKAHL